MRGGAEPEALLRAVPGIGPELARAIHDALQVDTLEALEIAAHDGRLEALRGVDREYREKSAAGKLPTIAPKRFNPEGVLERGGMKV